MKTDSSWWADLKGFHHQAYCSCGWKGIEYCNKYEGPEPFEVKIDRIAHMVEHLAEKE